MASETALSGSERLVRFKVTGMDCPSCVGKIETALARIPGVREPQVSLATEILVARVEDASALETIQKQLGALGFEAKTLSDADARAPAEGDAPRDRAHDEHSHDGDAHDAHAHGQPSDGPWWTSRKARLVGGIGLLVAAAFGISYVDPAVSDWAYIAAAVIGLVPFGRRALVLAGAGSPFSIEMLMSVATIGAIAIGASSEAAIVVFLFALGELMENVAAGRARSGIKSLMNLVPKTALVEERGATREVRADSLQPGQTVLVRPGDRVPTDGEIVEGQSSVDESPVTGESVPVDKTVGATVYAGSINVGGVLRIRVTKRAQDNTIARIIHMVEQAQSSKAPTARFIDRFSRYYTPGAMLAAALVILVPPLAFGADWYTWIYRGLALLLIACPCALVLSTPAAIASGLAAGARRGLLVKGGAALETIGSVTTVAFDKTGTLTEGKPQVTDVLGWNAGEADVLSLAASVETGSSHPIAQAILARAHADGIEAAKATEAGAIPGKAVQATVSGRALAVGSPRYAAEVSALRPDVERQIAALEEMGKTVVVLLEGNRALGAIALRDEPRADARAAIQSLQRLGARTIMLTGDNRRTGAAIAGALGVDVKAELLPDHKLREIGALKAASPVAMVGDGINDAPALAAASLGIAMGGGTDVALETADAALLKNRVHGVAELVALSRATMANIRQNIGMALGLKGVFLVTSLLGITTLWMAILADTGATVIVTANALRLLRFAFEE